VWAWPGYLALAAGLVAGVVAPRAVHAARYAPLAASLVVVGLPHGAVDHLVPGWLRGAPLERRDLLRLLAAYGFTVAAGVGLWLAAPLAGLAVFLLVAVLHWGTADLAWSPGVPRPAAFAAARGLVAIAVPAFAHPHGFARAVQTLLAPFLAAPPSLAASGWARGAGLAALALVGLAGAGRRPREMLELAGLAAFFVLVDPVFAVGLYFVAWHSWRHVVRLAALEPVAARLLTTGRPWAATGRVLQAALPCTVIALAGLLALTAVLAVRLADVTELTAVALSLIAALTVPHAAVVAWLDGWSCPVVASRRAYERVPAHRVPTPGRLRP
jgi:Brp/Blh family beta-carotene 15,15'-monooxygenase